MRRTFLSLIAAVLCATSARAERYLVLNSFHAPPVSDAEISRLGGAVVTRLYDRIEIELSPKAVGELQANLAVAYVQPVNGQEQGETTSAPAKPAKHPATPEFAPPTWFSGAYKYDGSGNITAIGTAASPASDSSTNSYTYDVNSRLHAWTLTNGPNPRSEEYNYDTNGYGNLTSIKVGNNTTAIGVDPATNRLTNHDYTSSGPGNLVDPYSGESLSYDAFNMVASMTTAGGTTKYLYTPEDERVGTLRSDTSSWTWSIRGADHQILRQYSSSESSPTTSWLWIEDYVYRDGLLLAAVRVPELGGRRHFHLDHLGTPRLITADDGSQIAQHDLTPWGVEITSPCQETSQGYDRNELRVFTGHERDYQPACSDGNVLDYMHARDYGATIGRFLSADSTRGRMHWPGSLNRYSYASDNPMNATDPTGLLTIWGERPKNDSEAWNSFWDVDEVGDFFQFTSGLANAYGSDLLFGAGRQEHYGDAYQFGQFMGDAGAMLTGLGEIESGFAGEAGGFMLDATGVGALVGVPVNVASGALILHGSSDILVSGLHMMSGVKKRKQGSLGEFKGTEAKSAENKQLKDAMTVSGHGGDPDKQRMIHEVLQGLEKMNFHELVNFIRDFFN